MSGTDAPRASTPLAQLRASARGWHGVQLATIGFIGLCGVLQGGRPDNPMGLQVFAGLLALAALALGCVATFLVARVAWSLYGGRETVAADGAAELARDGARLRKGLVPARLRRSRRRRPRPAQRLGEREPSGRLARGRGSGLAGGPLLSRPP